MQYFINDQGGICEICEEPCACLIHVWGVSPSGTSHMGDKLLCIVRDCVIMEPNHSHTDMAKLCHYSSINHL